MGLNKKERVITLQEIWKDIKGYDGLYQVSNFGRVKSLKRVIIKKNNQKQIVYMKILKHRKDRDGYLQTRLFKNGKLKVFYLHRLVAIAFIPNPYNKLEVNHINHIRDDCNLTNLEWITHLENIRSRRKTIKTQLNSC